MSGIDSPPPPLAAKRPLHVDPAEHCDDIDEVSADWYYLTIDGDNRDVPEVLDLVMGALVEHELASLEHELALVA